MENSRYKWNCSCLKEKGDKNERNFQDDAPSYVTLSVVGVMNDLTDLIEIFWAGIPENILQWITFKVKTVSCS